MITLASDLEGETAVARGRCISAPPALATVPVQSLLFPGKTHENRKKLQREIPEHAVSPLDFLTVSPYTLANAA